MDSFDAYHQLVPYRGNYAFDLMVEVGLARLRDQRQDVEIQTMLHDHWGLSLPASSVGSLVHSFLDGVAALHVSHAPVLREWLEQKGGYSMHLDGTCEAGTDVLFTAMAEPYGWTLEAAKIRTENAREIGQVIQRSVELFGKPLAVVRDLSVNIQQAKRKVLPDVLDLICHYHFLENVGEKLCEKPHAKLTNALRRLKVRPALTSLRYDLVRWSNKGTGFSKAQVESLLLNPEQIEEFEPVALRRLVAYILLRWLDDYASDLRGEYFPFDLPSLAFYRRGLQLSNLLKEIVAIPKFPRTELSVFSTMARHLALLNEDAEAATWAQRLEKAAGLFEELRTVLRFSSRVGEPVLRTRDPSESGNGQKIAQQLEKRLRAWRDGLQKRHDRESDPQKRADQATVLKYLEKYRNELVGHVIEREGREPFVVSRTNNPVEHRFSSTKRGMRRKVGAKKLTRHLQATRGHALLVCNLTDPHYVDLVLEGNLTNLPSAIAKHWQLAQSIRKQRLTPSTQHPMPTSKKQLRNLGLLDRIKKTVNKMVAVITQKKDRAA
jgi:hypothetical protein